MVLGESNHVSRPLDGYLSIKFSLMYSAISRIAPLSFGSVIKYFRTFTWPFHSCLTHRKILFDKTYICMVSQLP
jgi:hypothetical protein